MDLVCFARVLHCSQLEELQGSEDICVAATIPTAHLPGTVKGTQFVSSRRILIKTHVMSAITAKSTRWERFPDGMH